MFERLENRKPSGWTRISALLCNINLFWGKETNYGLAQLSALSSHVPFFFLRRGRRESRGLVTALNAHLIGPSRVPVGSSPREVVLNDVTADQLLSSTTTTKEGAVGGSRRKRDWKETPHCDSWCAVLKVTFLYFISSAKKPQVFLFFEK